MRLTDTRPDASENGQAVEAPSSSKKAVTISLNEDGGITIDPSGFSPLELPSLFRLAAKIAEGKLGI